MTKLEKYYFCLETSYLAQILLTLTEVVRRIDNPHDFSDDYIEGIKELQKEQAIMVKMIKKYDK